MTAVEIPAGFSVEPLQRNQSRSAFDCGQGEVNDWLQTKALQHQEKRLSATKVLLDPGGSIAGFYTLATGQVDFGDLPSELARKLPRRALPVAILAWLGVSRVHQGRKLGGLLLAQALRDCHEAGQTFAFVAVILDCVDCRAKAFTGTGTSRNSPATLSPLFECADPGQNNEAAVAAIKMPSSSSRSNSTCGALSCTLPDCAYRFGFLPLIRLQRRAPESIESSAAAVERVS